MNRLLLILLLYLFTNIVFADTIKYNQYGQNKVLINKQVLDIIHMTSMVQKLVHIKRHQLVITHMINMGVKQGVIRRTQTEQ